MVASNTYGRQVVVPLINKSGGGVIKGDVCVIDTTNNDAFTTSTAGAFLGLVGIAEETIASNATGRVLTAGYASLVNVNASVTRGNFGKTHTVAKQAVDAGASRVVGVFCQFLTGGTTPDAVLFGLADASSATGNVATDAIWDAAGDLAVGTGANTAARLASGAAGTVLTGAGVGSAPTWAAAVGITHTQLGTTSAGASFATARGNYAKKITLATAGLIASIGAFVKDASVGNNTGLGVWVFSDSTGPLNTIAVGGGGGVTDASTNAYITNLVINATTRAIEVPVGTWLAAGDYWLVVGLRATADSRLELAFNSATGSDKTQATNPAMDSTITAWSASTNDYCIYANILR